MVKVHKPDGRRCVVESDELLSALSEWKATLREPKAKKIRSS
jgi:hypothetical protein